MGSIDFSSDTSQYYREHIFQPWFGDWLRGQAGPHVAEATTFETGAHQWRQYRAWPRQSGIEKRRLYFREGRGLLFAPPTADGAFDEYVSDPSNPVPYRLIDVYPDDAPDDSETKTKMAGFQLIIADEILRARFRNGFEKPEAVPAGEVVRYALDLHSNVHAFLKVIAFWYRTEHLVSGIRPQSPEVLEAHAEDYMKATDRIYRKPGQASAIVLPVVK